VSKFNLDTFQLVGTPMNTLAMFGSNPDAIRTAAYSSDGKEILGGLDGKLFLLAKGKPKTLAGHSEVVLCSAFAPTGEFAATGGGGTLTAGTIQPGADNKVRVWNVNTATLAWSGEGHKQSVLSLAFSPSGKLLASGSADGAIKIWKVEDGSLVATFSGHTDKVLALAFSSDERTLWSGATDRTLREWRLP
jgi:WD40 repeat protein